MATVADLQLDPNKEYELVNGQPEEKIMGGAEHGWVGMQLAIELGGFIRRQRLGGAYGPDTTFLIGSNERLPDFAFVSRDRVGPEGQPRGIWRMAPDLAVEVVSPRELYQGLLSKVDEYLAAGVREVWLVDPQRRNVTIYRSARDVAVLTEEDELASPALFPGFRYPVAELFRSWLE